MSKIAVDIDGTLYDFELAARQEFLNLAHERGDKGLYKGAYNPWQEWRSMEDTCGQDICFEVIERVHADKSVLGQAPFPDAPNVLWDLVNAGHELHYISNRDEKSRRATHTWLYDWDFPHHESLTCNFGEKVPQVDDCQYIIDDRPKTLVHFVHDFTWRLSKGGKPENQRLGFGLAFPFNQALTDISRIYLSPTWLGLKYYFEDKGLLNESSRRDISLTA